MTANEKKELDAFIIGTLAGFLLSLSVIGALFLIKYFLFGG